VGGEGDFILLVGVGPGVGIVRVRFGIVLRQPARKTLGMGGREVVWYVSEAMLWVSLGEGRVGGFGCVFWMQILGRFSWGSDGGWVVVSLFRVWVCGIFGGCMLGGEVKWLGGELENIGISRIVVSASLPPCSLRIFAALFGVLVNSNVHNLCGQ
jgi:hypothetical protein